MRARAGVANVLEALGRCEEAMAHYRELLRLNPNDNQGVRFSLLSLYLQESRDKEARDLLKAYPDDKSMATGSYAQALLSYRKEGDSATARRHLKKALETNRHVPGYLLGEEEFPPIIPPSYSLGSIDEAVLCADNMLEAWEEPPEALEWLDEYRRSGSKRIRKKSIKKKRKTKKKS